MGGPGPPAAHEQIEQPEPPREQGLLCGRVHSKGTCMLVPGTSYVSLCVVCITH